jgi:hypothetical protein
VTIPDWFTAYVTIPHFSNEKFPSDNFGMRFLTVTANKSFGVPALAAGSWPNNAPVTFWGFYRSV